MISATLLTICGWLLLALAMPSHQRQLLKRVCSMKVTLILRILGCFLLFSAAFSIAQVYATSIAVVMWLMLLTATAYVPVLLISFTLPRFYFSSLAISSTLGTATFVLSLI